MPKRELERLQAVNRFLKLKIVKQRELQELVELAADICGTPTALISLIDEDTQYIPIKKAFKFDTTPRSQAFCHHAIEQEGVFVVSDAVADERFHTNTLVTGAPHIRFYAGTPLTTSDGLNLGSLCVIDQRPREIDQQQQWMLQMLAQQVVQILEFDASLALLKEQFLLAKQEEYQLRSFFDSCSCAHLLLDLDLKIIAFSKAMYQFVLAHHGVIIKKGDDIMSMIDAADRERVTLACQDALKGHSTHMERHLVYPHQNYWWDVNISPAYNADGEIIGVSYNGSDVTERILQQQVAERHQQQLEEIAFIQSHELRRPVATIKGLLLLLDMQGLLEESSSLQEMKLQIDIMDEKIHQIVAHTAPHHV